MSSTRGQSLVKARAGQCGFWNESPTTCFLVLSIHARTHRSWSWNSASLVWRYRLCNSQISNCRKSTWLMAPLPCFEIYHYVYVEVTLLDCPQLVTKGLQRQACSWEWYTFVGADLPMGSVKTFWELHSVRLILLNLVSFTLSFTGMRTAS